MLCHLKVCGRRGCHCHSTYSSSCPCHCMPHIWAVTAEVCSSPGPCADLPLHRLVRAAHAGQRAHDPALPRRALVPARCARRAPRAAAGRCNAQGRPSCCCCPGIARVTLRHPLPCQPPAGMPEKPLQASAWGGPNVTEFDRCRCFRCRCSRCRPSGAHCMPPTSCCPALQEAAGRSGLQGPGLDRMQRTLYGLGIVLLRYLWARADQFSAAQHWGDLPRGCVPPPRILHPSRLMTLSWRQLMHGLQPRLCSCAACMHAHHCERGRRGAWEQSQAQRLPLTATTSLKHRSWGWLAWRGMRGAETAFRLASLANFLAFLRFGQYRCCLCLSVCAMPSAQTPYIESFQGQCTIQASAPWVPTHELHS